MGIMDSFFPRVWGSINPGTGAGGTARGQGLTGAQRTALGVCVVTLDDGFAAQEMGFHVTPSENNAAGVEATYTRTSATTLTVQTHLGSTGAAIDSTFDILGWVNPPGVFVTT